MEKIIFDTQARKDIIVCQELEESRQRSIWYSGALYLFNHKGYRFYIEAKGTVNATLFARKPQRGPVVAEVNDFLEEGLFYDTFQNRILSDAQLDHLVKEKCLKIRSTNTFELFVQDSNGECVRDSFKLPVQTHTEALRYVLDRSEEFLIVSAAA